MSRVAENFQRRETVGPVGRRRQAEREPRPEVAEQLLIRFGGRVVGLVDDQVGEVLGREAVQMPRQALHRSDEIVAVGLADVIEEKARASRRARV